MNIASPSSRVELAGFSRSLAGQDTAALSVSPLELGETATGETSSRVKLGMDTKTCTKCKRTLPTVEFARDASKRCGFKSICKGCDRAKAGAYYRANRDRRRAYWQAKRDEMSAAYFVLRAVRIYGGQCIECGSVEDLEFDHVDNNGAAHREVETLQAVLRRIVRTGQPITDYRLQLLCKRHHLAKTLATRGQAA
ncbi:hypothetical protein [Kribbella sp. DT2]|uniref:hypothetical protein n=1 Tax=Kribbella sp. DT2 TaxID=3393427 RepID=UPI003CF340A3